MARGEIVPYSELILFIQEGLPVLFHLHDSLEDTDRESLQKSILVCLLSSYLSFVAANTK